MTTDPGAEHIMCYVSDFLSDGIAAGCSCGWEGRLRFDYMDQVDAADEWGDHCDTVFMEATESEHPVTPDPGAERREAEAQQELLDSRRLFDPMAAAMFEYGRRIGERETEAKFDALIAERDRYREVVEAAQRVDWESVDGSLEVTESSPREPERYRNDAAEQRANVVALVDALAKLPTEDENGS